MDEFLKFLDRETARAKVDFGPDRQANVITNNLPCKEIERIRQILTNEIEIWWLVFWQTYHGRKAQPTLQFGCDWPIRCSKKTS